jgi:hypothetical protein
MVSFVSTSERLKRVQAAADRADSPHLRYVSAPLAAANITILYQSSYHADFLLVKETDFEQASAIFAMHNCQPLFPFHYLYLGSTEN